MRTSIVRAGLVAAVAATGLALAAPADAAAPAGSAPVGSASAAVQGTVTPNFYFDDGLCVYWIDPGPPRTFTLIYCYA